MNFGVSSGSIYLNQRTDFSCLGISAGTYLSDKTSIHFLLDFGTANLLQNSDLEQSIKREIHLVDLSLKTKHYINSSSDFLGGYGIIGGGISFLFFQYRNPLVAYEYDDNGLAIDTETIRSDGLSGVNIYIGTGFHLFNPLMFRIGGELLAGAKLWSLNTFADFENDVFNVSPYVAFRIEISAGKEFRNNQKGSRKNWY